MFIEGDIDRGATSFEKKYLFSSLSDTRFSCHSKTNILAE